jgi:hypothetical protein
MGLTVPCRARRGNRHDNALSAWGLYRAFEIDFSARVERFAGFKEPPSRRCRSAAVGAPPAGADAI